MEVLRLLWGNALLPLLPAHCEHHHAKSHWHWNLGLVILGLISHQIKLACPYTRLWRWLRFSWPLEVSNSEALSTKTMIRVNTYQERHLYGSTLWTTAYEVRVITSPLL